LVRTDPKEALQLSEAALDKAEFDLAQAKRSLAHPPQFNPRSTGRGYASMQGGEGEGEEGEYEEYEFEEGGEEEEGEEDFSFYAKHAFGGGKLSDDE